MDVMQESRLEKLEEKVDVIKEDLVELKVNFRNHSETMKDKMEVFGEHIEGDRKIISLLQPVLEKLPTIVEMAQNYEFEKMKEKEFAKKKKNLAYYLGTVATILGLLFGAIKAGLI